MDGDDPIYEHARALIRNDDYDTVRAEDWLLEHGRELDDLMKEDNKRRLAEEQRFLGFGR